MIGRLHTPAASCAAIHELVQTMAAKKMPKRPSVSEFAQADVLDMSDEAIKLTTPEPLPLYMYVSIRVDVERNYMCPLNCLVCYSQSIWDQCTYKLDSEQHC
jgi:hypothetical protein